MLRPTRSVVTGLFAGGTAIASSYAVAGTTPEFVVAPINGMVVALTPSQVITVSILLLGSLGSKLGLVLSIGIAVSLFGLTAVLGEWVGDRYASGLRSDGIAGVTTGGITALIGFGLTLAPLSAAAAGIGAAAALLVVRRLVIGRAVPESSRRRRVLVGMVGLAGFGGMSGLVGREVTKRKQPSPDQVFESTNEEESPGDTAIQEKLEQARAQSFDVEGLPPLVSETEDFYEVDINSINPDVDATTWSLSVTGAVDQEIEFSYDELTDLTPEDRFVTLRCVGEGLNGYKLDTALWTGLPIEPLLETAGPQGEYVMLRAEDEYFEEFPLEALRTGFLAYGMNGEVLPRAHGYPMRALIPGHWGEINVKWVNEIEILSREMDGYWEQRGWHGTGPVNTVAKLWTHTTDGAGRLTLAGPAYAGTRGIQGVEVSIDGGQTWADAELGPDLPGRDVWRQWRHTVEPQDSAVDVVVRATDGTGTLQPETESDAFPSGASGWVSETIRL